ncbi:archaeosortase/exosortase family protein [Lentisphaera marina]|uniref:archaeosortase/exosortase family protein n=1 Tax=Lentisphaera marina TaxID=1111041 RepID=UPI0023655743|nr:archaeosortase/exosortase family protein [Lentisphaera marina]MDD7985533.1 archaeosortase/exosortase family protein [Lentisphaera marina]
MKLSHAILLCLLANWPSLLWLFHRFQESDGHCLFALLILVFFCLREKTANLRLNQQSLKLSLALNLLSLIALFYGLPAIAISFILIINLNLFISCIFKQTWHWPSLALLALTLPIMASVQFFLGYPLRLFATQASALILKIGGIHVSAHGTVLEWQGRQTIVDAPCSGINILWAGLLLISIISIHEKLASKEFFRFFSLGFLIIIAANIIRNTALFYLENTPLELPHFAHNALGLFIFALFAFSLIYLQKRMSHAKNLS